MKPPVAGPQNNSAVALAGAHGAADQESIKHGKSRTGRPEFQGKGTTRHVGQLPPAWSAPAGDAAADDLARATAHWGRS